MLSPILVDDTVMLGFAAARDSGKRGSFVEILFPIAHSRSRDVDCAGAIALLHWVGECDDVCSGIGERAIERLEELFVGRVVGPHGKDAAGEEMARELAKAFAVVEGLVAGMEQVSRRMIDVEKDGVE